ncbi:hypothetical protein ACFQQB_69425 [Nonomuraea rubra]|uniref:hypothetical protein n=1 Tax=Nonomuraea rubra TaxID=46180 RepID=UPI00362317E0
MSEAWDDHELLARLRAAIEAAEAVPRDFVEAGKSAFAWREIDLDMELAELAELTYDSAMHREEEAAALRADSAVLRALTFAATQLTIELEITEGALLGQVVPPQAGRSTCRAGPATGAAGDRRPGRVRHPRQAGRAVPPPLPHPHGAGRVDELVHAVGRAGHAAGAGT